MGPGHLGIALAAKPAAPKLPLWVLLVASELIDLLCFAFIYLGIETTGETRMDFTNGIQIITPSTIHWSHGLFMALIWSAAAAGIVHLTFRNRRSSFTVGLVVFSHWLLDFVVHPSDLPLLFAGSPKMGLGLWNTGPGLLIAGILEIVMLLGGLVIYLHSKGIFNKKVYPTTP